MIVIIDYGAGNTGSVRNALARLGYSGVVTDDKDTIQQASHVILPGVGEASTAMKTLRSSGLDTVIPQLAQPLLGICLGMQILCAYSQEGDTTCMNVFDVSVQHFPINNIIPHMGWNDLSDVQGGLFCGVGDADVYFVHSYYVPLCSYTMATCNYILPFSAALQFNNFYATQFHPERSGDAGERILKNFLLI